MRIFSSRCSHSRYTIKWDVIIPFDKMWERLNKLIKPNGVIALFGNEPFSSML